MNKMRKPNNYKEILNLLAKLNKQFPTYNMGRHLSTALADYPDTWGVSDKELLFALNKYSLELEMDVPQPNSLDKIIKDGMNLNTIFDDEGYDNDQF